MVFGAPWDKVTSSSAYSEEAVRLGCGWSTADGVAEHDGDENPTFLQPHQRGWNLQHGRSAIVDRRFRSPDDGLLELLSAARITTERHELVETSEIGPDIEGCREACLVTGDHDRRPGIAAALVDRRCLFYVVALERECEVVAEVDARSVSSQRQ